MPSFHAERLKWPDGRYGAYAAWFVIGKSIEEGENPGDIEHGLCTLPQSTQECKGASLNGCKNWLFDGLLKLHEAGYLVLEPGQLMAAKEQREEFAIGPCGDIPEEIKEEVWRRVDGLIESGEESPSTKGELFDLGEIVFQEMIGEDPEKWRRLDPPKW